MKDDDKPLTLTEAIETYKDNPQAAALACGLVLQQISASEIHRISKIIDDNNEERIAKLEKELDYWVPLGKKWLALKMLLSDKEERYV